MVNPRSKARIEARIQERVAHCVEFELNDPRRTFITITRVEVSDDLSIAKVFYSVYGTEGDKSRTAHMLEGASGFVKKQVGRVLKTRRIPSLRWIYDDSIELAAKMHETIQEALEKDRTINPAAHTDLPSPAPAPKGPELEHEYLDFLKAQEDEDGAS
ncbi:MAG: 30S ribosome-binding factor RbfA [Planctomycetes bacterium]|nr:30S ribosome-binding factor RbfA [Planctomycetota bacterium]